MLLKLTTGATGLSPIIMGPYRLWALASQQAQPTRPRPATRDADGQEPPSSPMGRTREAYKITKIIHYLHENQIIYMGNVVPYYYLHEKNIYMKITKIVPYLHEKIFTWESNYLHEKE